MRMRFFWQRRGRAQTPTGQLPLSLTKTYPHTFDHTTGRRRLAQLAKGDMPVACTLSINYQGQWKEEEEGAGAKLERCRTPLPRALFLFLPAAFSLSLSHLNTHTQTNAAPSPNIGRDRTFNVYLPENYDGRHAQPVWMHLRGVYSSVWGGELQPQYPGMPILCRDACALWDGMAGNKRQGLNPKRADNVIVVYPEAAFDDPNKRSVSFVLRLSVQNHFAFFLSFSLSLLLLTIKPIPNHLITHALSPLNSSGPSPGGAARWATASLMTSTTSASSSGWHKPCSASMPEQASSLFRATARVA